MGHLYRNKNTGDEYMLADRDPSLDARPNFEYVGTADGDNAAATANAERDSIAAAAQYRSGKATAPTPAGAAVPTTSHTSTAAREIVTDADRDEAGVTGASATQIGPHPELHPRTQEELEAQAAHDVANPPTTGVLARAKADQKSGRTATARKPAKAAAAAKTDQAKTDK